MRAMQARTAASVGSCPLAVCAFVAWYDWSSGKPVTDSLVPPAITLLIVYFTLWISAKWAGNWGRHLHGDPMAAALSLRWKISPGAPSAADPAELAIPDRSLHECVGRAGCFFPVLGIGVAATWRAVFNLSHVGSYDLAMRAILFVTSGLWCGLLGLLGWAAVVALREHGLGRFVARRTVVYIERGMLCEGYRLLGRRTCCHEIPLDRLKGIECAMGRGGRSDWLVFLEFEAAEVGSPHGLHPFGPAGSYRRVDALARSLAVFLSDSGLGVREVGK